MMQLEYIVQKPTSLTQKTPILFVHGAWHSAWCWNEFFMPYFAEHGYASYALSVRGHGSSDNYKSLNALRISDFVSDVACIAASLQTPPILVGHSMGGLIVQKYLETHSAPLAVLLASLPVGGLRRSLCRIILSHPWLFLKATLTMNLYHIVGTAELVREAFFSDDIDSDVLAKCISHLNGESFFAFLDMLFLNLPRPNKVTTPLLVLGAANDRFFSSKEVESTANAYNTQAIIVESIAHDMMLEKEWKKVADIIISHLRERIP